MVNLCPSYPKACYHSFYRKYAEAHTFQNQFQNHKYQAYLLSLCFTDLTIRWFILKGKFSDPKPSLAFLRVPNQKPLKMLKADSLDKASLYKAISKNSDLHKIFKCFIRFHLQDQIF